MTAIKNQVMNDCSAMSISAVSILIIPPANCVCGRVYCFHIVRPSERTYARKCVRDVLFP